MKRISDTNGDVVDRFTSDIKWKSVLLTAHVESAKGPSLHMLRSCIADGSTYEVDAQGELDENHAGSMVFVSGDELVFSLTTPIEHESDASLVVGFTVHENTIIDICTVGGFGDPPVVIRNLSNDSIFVVGSEMDGVAMQPGNWTIQATGVPDGDERVSIIRFKPAHDEEVKKLRRSA